jgi:hypothetical protein
MAIFGLKTMFSGTHPILRRLQTAVGLVLSQEFFLPLICVDAKIILSASGTSGNRQSQFSPETWEEISFEAVKPEHLLKHLLL